MEVKALNAEINNHALDKKSLPNKLKILNWGKNETNDGSVYLTSATLAVFDAYQKRAGRDKALAIDFDHCTVKGSKEYVPGQPKAIAGYGDPVIVEGDGLYLYNVEWTPLGEKFAKNYKDLSPAAVVDKQGVLLGLDSVGLTPHGAVRDLNFFSAKGFDETMIKQLTVTDQGGSNPAAVVVKGADYNMGGANPAVKLTPSGPVIKALAEPNVAMAAYEGKETPEEEAEEGHSEDCECADCMSARENKKLSADDSKPRSVAKEKTQGEQKTKTMSASNPSLPDAYKAQPLQYNSMNDTIIKKMAAEVGMDGEGDAEKVLFAFLAKYDGLKAELAEQLTKKENTEGGGVGKTFSADIDFLKKEIETLKTQKVADAQANDESVRTNLVRQAARDGKLIPLSADELKTVSIPILQSIVNNQPRNVVPIGSALRVLSVQDSNKPSREKAVAAFEQMIVK